MESKYTPDDLVKAVEMVRAGKSYREASRDFSVPFNTIRGAVLNRYSRNRGAPAAFTADEENKIVQWVLSMAAAGFPVGEKQVISYVGKLVKLRAKRAFPAVATSEEWAEIYMKKELEKIEKEDAKKRRIEERQKKKVERQEEQERKLEKRRQKKALLFEKSMAAKEKMLKKVVERKQ